MHPYYKKQKMSLGSAANIVDRLESTIIDLYLNKPYALNLVEEAARIDPLMVTYMRDNNTSLASYRLHCMLGGKSIPENVFDENTNVDIRLHAAAKTIMTSKKKSKALELVKITHEELEELTTIQTPKASFWQNMSDVFSFTSVGILKGERNLKGMKALKSNMTFHGENLSSPLLAPAQEGRPDVILEHLHP